MRRHKNMERGARTGRVTPGVPNTVDQARATACSEPSFVGTVDQWEDSVFRNAEHFRVHRLYGQGGRDSCQVATFQEAVTAGAEARAEIPGARILIYAVTAAGRSSLVPESRWAGYLS